VVSRSPTAKADPPRAKKSARRATASVGLANLVVFDMGESFLES
jgi:hypothetical protein